MTVMVYQYGVPRFWFQREPESAAILQEQNRRYDAYHYALCKLEVQRRHEERIILAKHCPQVDMLAVHMETATAAVQSLLGQIKDRRCRDRSQVLTSEEEGKLDALRKEEKACRQRFYQQLKTLREKPESLVQAQEREKKIRKKLALGRKRLKTDPAPARRAWDRVLQERTAFHAHNPLAAELFALEERFGKLRKKARKESGLVWGTYLGIEAALRNLSSGPPPFVYREDRPGAEPVEKPVMPPRQRCRHLRMQLQQGKNKPVLTVENLLTGSDPRVRVEMGRCLSRRGGQQRWAATLCLRLGLPQRAAGESRPKHEMVEWRLPFIYHRPFPPGSRISWIDVMQSWRGPLCETKVNFTLETPEVTSEDNHMPLCAVVPWAAEAPEGLEIARWRSASKNGSLVLPAEIAILWERAEQIQSLRDQKLLAVKEQLSLWIRENKAILPDWLATRAQSLRNPRFGSKQLYFLYRDWSQQRFAGDAAGWIYLLSWWEGLPGESKDERNEQRRQSERYLFTAYHAILQRAEHARNDCYRKWAAELNRKYGVIVLPNTNYATQRQKPDVDRRDSKALAQWRSRQQKAAPGLLRLYLEQKFARTERKEPRLTQCPHCEARLPRRRPGEQHLQCRDCGRRSLVADVMTFGLLRTGERRGGEKAHKEGGVNRKSAVTASCGDKRYRKTECGARKPEVSVAEAIGREWA